MACLQFIENNKPDKPGIWLKKGAINPVFVNEGDEWELGTWCFLMDLPEIKDPPKYREVRKGDEGRECEFKPSMSGEYKPARIVGFMSSGELIVEYENNGYRRSPNECRILDDGEPAKQPEWWFCKNKNSYWSRYSCKQVTSDEQIHVREVIEEVKS